MSTIITLVAGTYTDITTEVELLGNYTKMLTLLDDVSMGVLPVTHTPTSLQDVTGEKKTVLIVKPEGSTDKVWAHSTDGGIIILHGNNGTEYIAKDQGSVGNPLVGTGISSGGTAIVKESIARSGDIITTKIMVDLTGLDSSAGTTDIIGESGAANSWVYQVTTAKNGVIWGGSMECLETPVTGDVDIDLYSADEATGTEDAAVTALTDDRLLINGASMAIAQGPDAMALYPGPDQYIYFTGAGSTNATYSAGRFLITLIGLGA